MNLDKLIAVLVVGLVGSADKLKPPDLIAVKWLWEKVCKDKAESVTSL